MPPRLHPAPPVGSCEYLKATQNSRDGLTFQLTKSNQSIYQNITMTFKVSAIALATIAIVGASSTVDAFVVPSSSSSVSASTFVQRRDVAFVPSTPKSNVMTPSISRAVAGPPTSTTAMQMGLFDRFMRVAKGNINSVLQNLEAPEKIMNQAVEDMQKDLIKIRQSYAEVTAAQRRLLKQKQQAESVANDWYGRAQLALKRGKDELAREALARRQQQLELIKDLQPQIDAQATALDKLYEGMNAIEQKIVEARSKKEQFIARAKTAESVTKVNDMIGGMTGKTSLDAFRRMEEKVEALEAAAEASAEMSGLSNLLPDGSDALTLEKEFMLLEGSAAVDEELARMKKNILAPSSEDSKWKAKKYDPAVEIELEKVKAELS